MRKLRIKDKKSLYLVLGILMFSMLCAPALATPGRYGYEGFPLETVKDGTVQGDVYVSAGDNYGLNGSSWSYVPNTLITNFADVPTGNVVWAELKVGVWGGSITRVGSVDASLYNNTSSTYALGTKTLSTANPSDDVTGSGTGVWLACYNCTDAVNALNDGGYITANVTTAQGNPALDGRIYGAVLIVVYENGTSYTQYWINQGNVNLHKNTTSPATYPDLDANMTVFNGNANSGTATLTVGYFAGDYNQKDYLYLNAPNDSLNSPYNLANPAWTRNAYSNYLVGEDVADNMSNTRYNFDLKSFTGDELPDLLPSNNYALFWRGHSDTIPIFDPAYPGVNPETEGYYVPFLAVLKIK